MKTGVVVMSFGEPEKATLETVVPFLERIFAANASLEQKGDPEAARTRSRELAERRAPGLIEEYEEIGGSPLNTQARAQAEALEAELRERGHDVTCYVGMQFTEPFIAEAVEEARADGMERLVGLPVYPLCGRSTTVAALADLQAAVSSVGWEIPVLEISGWHRHPDYVPLHADNVRTFVQEEGVDLHDPATRLVFSAHGTPMKYLIDGPRYDKYVDEFCRALAGALGVEDYDLGFQNHSNRPVEWTQPEVDKVVRVADAERVVVVAVSFLHEQSETLAELDDELREVAEDAGLEFHRVPVPHEDPRVARLLADLVEARVSSEQVAGELRLQRCTCRDAPGTYCTNGGS